MKTNNFYHFLSIIASLTTFFVVLYIADGYYLAFFLAFLIYFVLTYIRLTIKNRQFKYLMEKDSLYFFETFMIYLDTKKGVKESLKLASKKSKNAIASKYLRCLRENKDNFHEALIAFKNELEALQLKNILTEIINYYENETNYERVLVSREDIRRQIDYLYETKTSYIRYEISNIPLLLATISLLVLVPLLLGIIFYKEVLGILF